MKTSVRRTETLSPDVYNSIILEEREAGLFLRSHDGFIDIQSSVACSPDKKMDPVTVLMSSRRFIGVLATLPYEDTIKLVIYTDHLKLISSKCNFKLPAIVITSVPPNPIENQSKIPCSFTLDKTHALDLWSKTIHAQSRDTNNSKNMNVLLLSKDTCSVQATDGCRAAFITRPISWTSEPTDCSIPLTRRNADTIIHMLSGTNAEGVAIRRNNAWLSFAIGEDILSVREFEKEAVNIPNAIWKPSTEWSVIDLPQFKEALSCTKVLLTPPHYAIKLSWKKDAITISTPEATSGTAEVSMPCDIKWSGKPDILFNVSFLLDVIASINSEKALLGLREHMQCVIQTEDGSEKYCIMGVIQ